MPNPLLFEITILAQPVYHGSFAMLVCAESLRWFASQRLPAPLRWLAHRGARFTYAAWLITAELYVTLTGPAPLRLSFDAGTATANPSKLKPVQSRPDKLTWLAKAMLTVRDNPDWSDAKIAKVVGKNRATLSRCSEYQTAATLARSGRELTKGYRTDGESGGRLEAVANPSTPQSTSDRGQPISGSKKYREYCSECGDPIRVAQGRVGKNPLCDSCKTG